MAVSDIKSTQVSRAQVQLNYIYIYMYVYTRGRPIIELAGYLIQYLAFFQISESVSF